MNRRKYLEIRRIFFIIIFILLGVIGIISFYLILKNADGYYREGLIGFICDAILRVFISLIICTTLFATFIFRESDRVHIIWWAFLVLSIIGIFILLKSPIEIKIFDINGETYDREKEKWGPYDNVLANIKYLPHTGVLIKLDTNKGRW